MNNLLAAIITKIGATAALTTRYGTRYYLNSVPEGTALPFLVVSVLNAPRTESYGNTAHYTAQVQFSVFEEADATSGAEKNALTGIALVTAAFDGITLTISGATNIDLYRENEPIATLQPGTNPTGPDNLEKSENVTNVAAAHAVYQIAVQ